ncbi:acetylcholinesterase-1-like [Haemaphysalis longicornis]
MNVLTSEMHSKFGLTLLLLIFCGVQEILMVKPPVVRTHSGLVAGEQLKVGDKLVDAFYGIPYASPPVGELRFEKPREVQPWKGVYNATTKTTACWQTTLHLLSNITLKYNEATEDCLHLNVWRPSGFCDGEVSCTRRNLSVVIFIYGGAFHWGDAGFFIFDAANFVALSDVVYVTFNHRVGILGFFPSPEEGKSGNMGLYDQQSVLRWVRRNIANFGGNPEDVTLVGQSAGAMAVGLHSISPTSRGLFQRAILQSATPISLIFGTGFSGSAQFHETASKLNCYEPKAEVRKTVSETLECLRRLDARTIYQVLSASSLQQQFGSPHFGDEFIPTNLLSAKNWKKIHVKEILLGTTLEEGAFFIKALLQAAPDLEGAFLDDYRKGAATCLSIVFEIPLDQSMVIVKEYFGGPDVKHDHETVLQTTGRILADLVFNCPAHFFAAAATDSQVSSYMYRFDHRPSYSTLPKQYGPTHLEDVPFTFGSLPFFSDESRFTPPLTVETRAFLRSLKSPPSEHALMRHVVGVWSSFVKGRKLVVPVTNETWPKYSAEHPELVAMKLNSFKRTLFKQPCHLFKPYLVKE